MSEATDIHIPELVEDLQMMTPPPEESSLGWMWWLLGFMLLMALLVPLYLTLRPHREAEGAPPEPEPPDPAIEARERLRRLRGVLADLSISAAAEETSAILRDYMLGRCQIFAPFQTTAELIAHLRKTETVQERIVDRIDNLLDACDFFKFAGGELVSGNFELLVDEAETMIVETTPKRENPEEAVNGSRSV